MGRPRTPIGSHGVIKLDQVGTAAWRARTLFRFPDGSRRQVQRVRRTRATATEALQRALLDLATPATGDLRPESRIADAADKFLAEIRLQGRLAPRTIAAYDSTIRVGIVPRIGDLRLAEATPGRLQLFITTVTKESGPGAAKMARTVLSSILGMATRDDALRANPVAQVAPIRQRPMRGAQSLRVEDVPAFIRAVTTDDELTRTGVGPLFAFLMLTGCRISEACGLAWSSIDPIAAKVTFEASVVRVPGHGLIRQLHGKTDSSFRTITIPRPALALLDAHERRAETVFVSVAGGLLDPNAAERIWRLNRVRLGYTTTTSHTCRKSVATALDVSGASARAIAEYLGHARPSVTQDVYMSRTVGSAMTASTLERTFGVSSDPA